MYVGENLLSNAARVGAYLKHQLLGLATRHTRIKTVRGVGLYVGIELDAGEDAAAAGELTKALVNGMRERRVLIGAAGGAGNVLKLRPPLTFSSAHADMSHGWHRVRSCRLRRSLGAAYTAGTVQLAREFVEGRFHGRRYDV